MSSRARIFAAVTLLAGCLAGPAAWAQAQNLDAGKSASQLFAGTCNACHKSPRGLLKTVSSGSLAGFLREHYTTGGEMASQLASYLISNGASDSRQTKQGVGSDQADRPGRKSGNVPGQEAARPDDTPPPPGNGVRQSRKRLTPPTEQPEEGRSVANAPAQPDVERGPDGRKLPAKQRNRLGKPPGAEEPSMANEPPKTEPATTESSADDKAKVEPKQEMGNAGAKPDAQSKAADEVKPQPVKSEAAKIEAPKDSASGMVRRDPVPPVTPAPAAAATSAPAPAVASGGSSEQAAPRPPAPAAPPPAAVTASAPPPSADGPPAPPISR